MWPTNLENKNLLLVSGSNQDDLIINKLVDETNSTVTVFNTNTTQHSNEKVQIATDANELRSMQFDCVWVTNDASTMSSEDIGSILAQVVQTQGFNLFWSHSRTEQIKSFRDAVFAFQRKQNDLVVLSMDPWNVFGYSGVEATWIPSTAPQKHEDLADVWTDVHMPLMWRAAVYSGATPVMSALLDAQLKLLRSLLAKEGSSYVEVGCGTAEMQSKVHSDAEFAVGVELSPMMLKLAKELHPELGSGSNHLVCANATVLDDALHKDMPSKFWETRRVVTILMNTLGILPDCIRQEVISQMIKVAGEDGAVVIGCWHNESFRVGMEEFYSVHPELCGPIDDATEVDYEKANMHVPSTGYESHWFSADELKAFVPEETHNVEMQVSGVGIFAIVTAKSRSD
eukprot:CAMPEP_0116554896 /NCGR_PEP_ID=MMETSP0397-20121206/7839_1 /TAXON_ID=216820 /ORGANISM="Cyclophora tenuis, Strain ECT3854" /LENGTH=398 /DNA_ID=CAMNT_0004080093 /DNA_START=133 /DNA_END=1329 /DNA_ORIENTATION=+